jgi:methylmalonyl-CoA mutase
MSETLSYDFKDVTFDEWEAKILKDLKGKDLSTVTTQTLDGITFQPHFNREKVADNKGVPGKPHYARGAKIDTNDWFITEIIEGSDQKKLNEAALKALLSGSNALQIKTPFESLDDLLNDIQLPYISVSFENEQSLSKNIRALESFVKQHKFTSNEIKGCYGADPIGKAAITGKVINYENVFELIAKHHENLPRYRFLNINAQHYHNAGASQAQELAFAMSHGHEYLVNALEAGIPIDEITARLQFTLAAGTEYFTEIAKFKAFRTLWSKIVAEYKPEHDCSHSTYVVGQTSAWQTTIADEYNNMLRATIQSMAAANGGADEITVLPFNYAYDDPTPFSRRIARNVNLILQEESHFDKILDAAGGSYFIDYLTDQLAQKAWRIFQDVESLGGFEEALKKNFVQNQIEQMAQKQHQQFNDGERVLVGVNKFAKDDEDMSEKIKKEARGQSQTKPTDFMPIKPSRLAAEFELKKAEEKSNA